MSLRGGVNVVSLLYRGLCVKCACIYFLLDLGIIYSLIFSSHVFLYG